MRRALYKKYKTSFTHETHFLGAKLVFVLLCHKITVFIRNSGRRLELVNFTTGIGRGFTST